VIGVAPAGIAGLKRASRILGQAMKAMDVHGLGIYRLRREPDGSYELVCNKCLHKVDLDEKGDPHAEWRKGAHVSLAKSCPNRKGDELEQQLRESKAEKDFGTGG